ncbi:hypothetical protein [Cellvibrio japonicus]|uniref:Uncharacterized protein n=1 Tax=Cellvibrio japonicus (strain Ueda107) TaxID=498211 RepID=B3PB49_CELJU|nr:hypothetical protein [Cellvibrio japonicus]ACE83314.1 hypothetical protein CJA_1021 [Cellvibrio japonicus Ueda107]QEI11639.1 hypothetical protein FY117_04955 [Cellvibrio japonicus]QEI15213.1 hypothetical protein FY116_04955 [Cellvibrio japonicus]QEI18793.1 hypothetical protein FY115_04955 [Cellvibrio japonicus]
MMYYQVVLSGDQIFFENVSAQPEKGAPDPIIGFISCRLIRASTEDMAVAIAKRDLLVHWNQSFNADRKLGMPKLHLEHIAQINSWFKPKIRNDYYWFTDEEHKAQQLSKFTLSARRWFWQR